MLGLEALLCPEDHPWSLGDGHYCCKYYNKVSDLEKDLDFTDPVTECRNEDFVKCHDEAFDPQKVCVGSPAGKFHIKRL